jgi:hypothetical protein
VGGRNANPGKDARHALAGDHARSMQSRTDVFGLARRIAFEWLDGGAASGDASGDKSGDTSDDPNANGTRVWRVPLQ